ncbi:hypothetical protein THRCLA_00202 [Thraustotheca clavata]|uniref:Fibronectin type-III domain-containing protein n=1 Tax=Thraustotheca clavata TaxID=74557 RepID=A0A1W0ABX8_9STRA|nr:hypothetical protein THRCLA_00202 [Thraustotheca clavata]
MQCVLTITAITQSSITAAPSLCLPFVSQAFNVVYYTIPPVTVSGIAIQGTPPYQYLIQGLTAQTTYYIRIAAVNSVPFQQISASGNPPNNCKWTFPAAVTPTNVLPDPILSAQLYVQSATSLELRIQPSTRDGQGLGGSAITFYSIDVDTVSTFSTPGRQYPIDVPIANFLLLYPGGPLVYYINNLVTGTPYFVQVRAKTSVGYSLSKLASNSLAPSGPPGAPASIRTSTSVTQLSAPITQANIGWNPPTLTGGLAVQYYHVEWWTTAPRAEVQVVQLQWTTTPTALTFTLAFGGSLTGSIPMNCAPENVRNALMNIGSTNTPAVPLIGNIEVTRTAINTNQGYQWSITFVSALPNQPMLQLAIVSSTGGAGIQSSVFEAVAGVAGGNTNFPGTPEVQVLTISHPTASQAVTGVFRLSFLGNVPALAVDTTNIVPSTSVATLYDGNNAVLNTGAWCATVDLVCAAIYSYVRIGEKAVGYGFYDSTSATMLTYTITNLMSGTSYYTSVTTRNLLTLGVRGAAYPVSIIPPKQVPSPPTAVSVNVKYGISTQLLVSYSTPVSNGGDTIRKYLIEYDATPAFSSAGSQTVWCPTANVNAVWRITSSKVNAAQPLPISAGWFQLKLSRANAIWTTDPIPYNAVAMGSSELGAQPAFSLIYCTTCSACTDTCDLARQQISGSMQKKLQGLLSITNGVTVTRTPTAVTDGGYVWSVTFIDPGDDFALEAIASSTGLNCAGSACANSDYQVAAVKVAAGTNYAPCTGTQTIPTVGALTKGQLYYIRVTAFNSVGFGLPQIAANPQKPMVVPGIPTGVSLVVYSVSSLQLVFSPPLDNGGDTITSYTVTWSLNADFSASSSMVVTNLSGGSPFYAVISGLTKGLFYFVQVQATNSQGTGLPALSSPLSLNPSAVPSAPTNVVLGVTSPSMLTVGWAPPADNGGDTITGYIVEWDIIASYNSLMLAPDHSSASISDPAQHSYTISLLTSQTAYYVHVYAVNSLGPGSPQDAAPLPGVPDLMPPGKPISLSAAAVTTPNAGIYVQWQAPYVPYHGIPCFGTLANPSLCPLILGVSSVFGGSGLRTYFVEWDTSPVFTGTNRVSAAGNNILLTSASNGIVSGTTYYIRVQTVNNNGYMSLFCQRSNQAPYLCPDNLALPDGSFVTGAYVTATAP